MAPDKRELIDRLIRMDSEMITAKDLAPILGMNPGRIVGYAKSGQWPRDVCNYIVSGSHVKFFRMDFLKKGGWIQ